MKTPRIVMVGGGSVNWSPKLINDLLLTDTLQAAEFVLLDTDINAGERMAKFGNMLCEKRGISSSFSYTDKQSEAFPGADFVLITISTGDLDAMEHDLIIPEKYGIYQTVGDTVGPGGWARALRNIPVFEQMAKNIEKYAPSAIVLNYTNPMAVLTNVFYKVSGLKTVGLCHGLFEVYDALMKIFDLEKESDIKVRFGGLNHFFWLLDMKIKGEDGYAMLKEKLAGRPFSALFEKQIEDEMNFKSGLDVCSELLDRYGYLTYAADRHTSEFLPNYLSGDEAKLKKYHLVRTYISDRRKRKNDNYDKLSAYISGEAEYQGVRSRETAADIINAFILGDDFIDVVNLPNIGQISNLPEGSIVETLGLVNSIGFTPITAGPLPAPLLNTVLPHAVNQNTLVEAGLSGDLEMAFNALYNDPLCGHLTLSEIREMGMELLQANKQYLPQFSL